MWWRGLVDGHDGAETSLYTKTLLYTKNRAFAKAGSGRIWEKLGKRCLFSETLLQGYSFDILRSVSRIAAIRNDSAAHARYSALAAGLAEKAAANLWRPELSAMYDRFEDDSWVPTLQHNNIRMMFFGVFNQSMADAFVRDNLMNTSRFWTKMPMPSIAVSDPHFQNDKGNNWSGPPEGLTLQRAIRALESYGACVALFVAVLLSELFAVLCFVLFLELFARCRSPRGEHLGGAGAHLSPALRLWWEQWWPFAQRRRCQQRQQQRQQQQQWLPLPTADQSLHRDPGARRWLRPDDYVPS